MNILLYGGAFNPVHNEHIFMLKYTMNALKIDKAFVIPSAISPHKDGKLLANSIQRYEMCKIAFSSISGVEVSSYELDLGDVSYTYRTAEHYKKLYPNDKLYFLMGADMFESFLLWREPRRILNAVTLAVCQREGEKSVHDSMQAFKSSYDDRVEVINFKGAPTSSTLIRCRASLGYSIDEYSPKKVVEYIESHAIYLQPELKEAQSLMKEKRAKHVLRVTYMAMKYCQLVGVSEMKALIAASLHDSAKNLELDNPLLKGFIPPNDVPKPVLHQYSGAYLAQNVYGVEDDDIINAITYHTSGRSGMSLFEKYIYLCDMLEEARDFEGVQALRAVFKRDVEQCFKQAIKHQYEYLKQGGKPIYYLTEECYNYIYSKEI